MQALGKLPTHIHTYTHTHTHTHSTAYSSQNNSSTLSSSIGRTKFSGGWRVCAGGCIRLRWVLRQCWKEEDEMLTVFYLNFCDMIQLYLSNQFSSIQLLSCVRLFVTPWTAAHQVSQSITNSRSLLKLMSIESVMPSNHLILFRPLLCLP